MTAITDDAIGRILDDCIDVRALRVPRLAWMGWARFMGLPDFHNMKSTIPRLIEDDVRRHNAGR